MNGQKKILWKSILIVIAVLAAAGGLAVYLTRTRWYGTDGSVGNFSKDTYLGGGTGKHEYTKHIKIHYQYTIIAGSMRFELTDESGQVVYGMDITESSNFIQLFYRIRARLRDFLYL